MRDVEALVAKRVESLRNPTGATFEDRTPDGRNLALQAAKADRPGQKAR